MKMPEQKIDKEEVIRYRLEHPLSTLKEAGQGIIKRQRVAQILEANGMKTANVMWGKNYICPKCGEKSWIKNSPCSKCRKKEKAGMKALKELIITTADIPIFNAFKRKGEIFAIPDPNGHYRAMSAEQVERALAESHCGFGVDVRIKNVWYPLGNN
jgi:predicted RNA-binding Zn-ribbon protein involved in translation (DUF1610 family)